MSIAARTASRKSRLASSCSRADRSLDQLDSSGWFRKSPKSVSMSWSVIIFQPKSRFVGYQPDFFVPFEHSPVVFYYILPAALNALIPTATQPSSAIAFSLPANNDGGQ